LASSCHWDLHDPGTEPVPTQFFFPAGIAMDPGGRYAYVTNGNADLRYGGGAVMMVDLQRFECASELFRQNVTGLGAGLPAACSDPAQAMDDSVNAGCLLDPIDPSIVDCDETRFIIANATVKVGNFAGALKLRRIDDRRRTLYAAVRGDPSVTRIDVDLGHDLSVPGTLDCFDDPASLTGRPGYDPKSRTNTAPPVCDVSHLIQTYSCVGRPMCTQEDNQIPPEPFGLALDDGLLGDGRTPYARLLVSHLAGGEVMLIDILPATPVVRYVSSQFFVADPSGRHGAFALAPQFPHQSSSAWYLTSDIQPTVQTFRIADANVVVPAQPFTLSGVFVSGADVRDIVFEPGGARAFLTENNPPSLVVLDTRTLPNGALPGVVQNRVVDVVDVCQTPAHMGVRRRLTAGAPGTPPRLATKVYVPCFLSNQVMVVDPDRPGVDETILTGRGPNEISFNFSSDGEAEVDVEPMARRGYVTTFTESAIAVIDLQPGSPTENRVIARIGLPELPKTQ
jgi:DNA-binding beta-propeller fold protein YncE